MPVRLETDDVRAVVMMLMQRRSHSDRGLKRNYIIHLGALRAIKMKYMENEKTINHFNMN